MLVFFSFYPAQLPKLQVQLQCSSVFHKKVIPGEFTLYFGFEFTFSIFLIKHYSFYIRFPPIIFVKGGLKMFNKVTGATTDIQYFKSKHKSANKKWPHTFAGAISWPSSSTYS